MKSPVLFIIFKREDTTRRVFERLREAQPPRLYIAADGPRVNRPDEVEKCKKTRKIVETIDWSCEVHHLYHDQNLGCGKGVSSAISWFFEQEEQGIIIEDDILPHIDFFRYCDEMLERYKNDERIQLISGTNYFYDDDYHTDSSYYMSRFMSIWGWASWRRVWNTYEFDVNQLNAIRIKQQLYSNLPRKSAKYFMDVYYAMKSFKVDTWDFQLFLNQQYYNRFSISPFTNMVENIGMGVEGATHTNSVDERIINHHAKSPYPLCHPSPIKTDINADMEAMRASGQYKKNWLVHFFIRIKNKLKNYI